MSLPQLALLLAALAGTPLFVVIAGFALLGYQQADIDPQALVIEFYRLAELPVLLAIPLFTTAGYVLGASGAPKRLLELSQAWLGWLPGGLAIVAITTCAFFTALTGASGVTIVALGALLYPALKQAGYTENFSLGLVTSSGSLGLLFAPSVPLILYGVVAQQLNVGPAISIEELFIAGILPGVLMLMVLASYGIYQRRGAPRSRFELRTALLSLRRAGWELPLPILLVVGIYGGYLAVSEAAAITALYVLIVEVLILREIGAAQLVAVLRDSTILVGGILLILGMSLASTNVMIDAGIPEQLFGLIEQHVDSRLGFLLLLNVFLLALGMMLDIFSAIVLIIPIILPVALSYGVDPLHLGIVFLANMQIGYFTPPVGMNLFIASYRFDKSVMTLYRATLPYFFLLLACVLLITYWPALSLGLVEWYRG